MSISFAELRRANERRQAEWCPDEIPDASFRAVELAGEVGEACNVVKKIERERKGWRGSRADVSDLAGEIADVVISADLLAMTAQVDLGLAVAEKFNSTSAKYDLAERIAVGLLSAAAEDVLAERQRQVSVEGWTPEHDDAHEDGELAEAASCYAAFAHHDPSVTADATPIAWPWSPEWWKPKDRRRNLVRAGALILAEIERLDRAGWPR